MATKQPVNVRLTDEARDLLDAMSKGKGISRTAVMEQAIRDYAEAEGYRTRQSAALGKDET